MQAESVPARLALVIGNSDYKAGIRLKNPCNDARAVAEKLVDIGFVVRTEFDLDGERFQRVIGDFVREVAAAAGAGDKRKPVTALLYYAGHGVQVNGENFLLPVDGDFASEADLQLRTVNLSIVMNAMNSAASTSIVMLDCCRDNPLPRVAGAAGTRSLASHHGLAGIDAPNGTFVAFATQPDAVAEDGAGEHSPFTAALLKFITNPDTPISELMIYVRRTVHEATGGRQIPWDRSALFEPFAFAVSRGLALVEPLDPKRAAEAKVEAERAREAEYWSLIEKSDSTSMLQSFVVQFPHSSYRTAALAKIDRLRYRRWRSGVVQATASVVLGILALIACFVAVEYMRFSSTAPNPAGGPRISLKNADLIGNDISLPISYERGDSLAWCRIKCIFDSKCVAISWDPGAIDAKGRRSSSVCYTKLAATYFMRPDPERGDDSANTEYMRKRGRKPPVELPANWTLHWDRTLVGEPVPPEKVRADPKFLGTDGK
ncbi:MAG: caspase domain-containing protein, partial [Hyphomicrobiaceae bacterium]